MRDSRRDLWAVVLAGGAGDSPVPLRHTLERVARLIPPSQTVVVTHADDGAAEVAGSSRRPRFRWPSWRFRRWSGRTWARPST